MAFDSKYGGLEDISSEPTVYETADEPLSVSNQYSDDSDGEPARASSPNLTRRGERQTQTPGSENIDGARLDAGEARRRFGEASFLGGGSTRHQTTSSRRRLPSTTVYSLADRTSAGDDQEKETTLERLRRLRSEVAELEEDVKREQVEAEASPATIEEGSAKGKGKKREVSPAVLLQQLQLLRGDLSGLKLSEKDEGDVLEGEGQREMEDGGVLAEKARSSKGLLERLGQGSAKDAEEAGLGSSSTAPKPPTVPVKEGELEKRLADLERMLGANEADVDETHPLPSPVLPTLARLDHLLTLLTQPRHLDSISRRVKVLVGDLERLHDSRRKLGDVRPLNLAIGTAAGGGGGMTVVVPGVGGEKAAGGLGASVAGVRASAPAADTLPPDALQRIDALFTLLPRLDPLLPLTPRLLTRLRSLSALHSSAASFSTTLSELKDEVGRLGEGERSLNEVLSGLEESVGANEARMKGNLEGLEQRLENVVQRLGRSGL